MDVSSSFVEPSLLVSCFLLPYILLESFRYVLSKETVYYRLGNELLCTVLWLVWCFQLQVLNDHIVFSDIPETIITFILLVVQVPIYNGAYGNPCVLMVDYCKGHIKRDTAISYFLIQLLAVPVSIGMVYYMWIIVSPLSNSHYFMLQNGRPSFLFSPKHIGILCEALITFIAFMPERFMAAGITRNLISALYHISIARIIGPFTGAFFNPLPITAFALFFFNQTWAELAIVYWSGSALGGITAYYFLFKQQNKYIKLH